MNIKTVTTVDGVNAVDFGSAASRFYWFRNIGAATVYVSGNSDISAGGDGAAELPSGGSVCIEAMGGKVYVLGAGKVQIHNTGDKFCPFRDAPVSSGGGVELRYKIEAGATDVNWEILENGSSLGNLNFKIVGYEVSAGDVINVRAKNPAAKCKFIFQKMFNVPVAIPNPNMIGSPYNDDFDGQITVPDGATWICFSVPKDDFDTGIYKIVGGD